jgi:hypothetical protein
MNDKIMFYIVKDGTVFILKTPLDNADQYEYTTDPTKAQAMTLSEAKTQADKISGSVYQVTQSYKLVNL